jgi:hypothetical protein
MMRQGASGVDTAIAFWFGSGSAMVCLAIADAADMLIGVFRGTIWNETITNEMRGRLAGIEMLSYTSGPTLGNLETLLIVLTRKILGFSTDPVMPVRSESLIDQSTIISF